MKGHGSRPALRGAASAVAAFLIWGLLPLYWKALEAIPPSLLIALRVLLSLVALIPLMIGRGSLGAWWAALRDPGLVATHLLSGGLLTGNWLVYVWATQNARIVEGSVGYFLNPLVNVVLGYVFFQERLRPLQWAAVSLAAVGVALQVGALGRIPWVALTLALSFGFYGLVRKKSPLGSISGLALETLLFAPFAAGWLLWIHSSSGWPEDIGGPRAFVLLGLAGVLTTAPLLCFGDAARRVRLSTLGLLQFIAPSLQFVLGAFVYGEPLSSLLLVSLGFVWVGLGLYAADALRRL